ncbi:cache domain-containing protein [Alcaligenaceae bacterium]|nr:cache domain-containing protein [Alcaligenaceae bacterium]
MSVTFGRERAPRRARADTGKGDFFAYHGVWAPGIRLFRRLSFKAKAGIIAAVIVLPLLALLGWQLAARNDDALQARMDATRQVVEVAHSILASYHAREAAGELTREQAMAQALRDIARVRYGGDEYFWVNDMQPTMIMHPISPQLDGQALGGVKDPNGLDLFNVMVAVARQHGEGVVGYQWPRPGGNVPVDKISFVKLFEPWGWIIGSGVYADDIREAALKRLAWNSGVVALSLFVLAYLFWSFYRVMEGGLLETRRHLHAMKEGNLTTSPAPWGSDEPAQLMHDLADMQASLRSMVVGVRAAAEEILHSSNEISSATVDLSARTEHAASNLQETAAAMEQIRSTVSNTTENTMEGAQVVEQNADAAASGARVMREMASTMSGIRDSSSKISEIIGTIDSIAFQTNILALNAAVEAARTGEHGRGFAVVAGEVRTLAHHSAAAASEIKKLIGTSVSQVQTGAAIANEAGAAIEAIVASSQRANELLSEIATGAREQSVGVEQIGKAVSDLDDMTQHNAAMVQETVAAASAMRDQAIRLSREVARFQLPAGSVPAVAYSHDADAGVLDFDDAIEAPR